jgi:hypothetical protein
MCKKSLILLVIFTVKEEPGLKIVGNEVLSRIFGPKREKVAGGWRKLVMRNFIIYTLQPHVIRMIK